MEQRQVYHDGQEVSTENPVSRIGFIPVANDILYDCSLSAMARFVYTIIRSFMYGDKTDCWPGMARLSEITGMSEKTVRGYLDELITAGLLIKKRRGPSYDHGRTNLYSLTEAALKRERGAIQTLNLESRPVNITDQDRTNFPGLDRPKITAKEDKEKVDKGEEYSVRLSEKVELPSTQSYTPEKPEGAQATTSSKTTPFGKRRNSAEKQQTRTTATGIRKTDSALERIQKLNRLPNGEEFVSYLFSHVGEPYQSELRETAGQFGSNWKKLIQKYDLTFEEAAQIMERTGKDLYSPQEAVRDLVREGDLSAAKFASADPRDSNEEYAPDEPTQNAHTATHDELAAIRRVLDSQEIYQRVRAYIQNGEDGRELVRLVQELKLDCRNLDAFDEWEVGKVVQDELVPNLRNLRREAVATV